MIKSFVHKGLEKFFLTGSKAGIQSSHADRLARQLAILSVAKSAEEMDQPGWKLHRLLGREVGLWSVWINDSWRLTFRFIDEDVDAVNYLNYH